MGFHGYIAESASKKRRRRKKLPGFLVETAGPPSRGYESVAERGEGGRVVAGYTAPGTSPDGVMGLRGLLFPPGFYIPFSFHSIP